MADQANGSGTSDLPPPPNHDRTQSPALAPGAARNGGSGASQARQAPPTNGGTLATGATSHDPALPPAAQPHSTALSSKRHAPAHDDHHPHLNPPFAPVRPPPYPLPAQHDGPAPTPPPAARARAPTAVEGFVQPASYLRRPRGLSRPMPPEPRAPPTAVDRDQVLGLVCFWPSLHLLCVRRCDCGG